MPTPAIPVPVRTAMRHALVAGVARPEIARATGYSRVAVWRYTRDLVGPREAGADERAARRLSLVALGLSLTEVGRREGCSKQAVGNSFQRHRARIARQLAEVRADG